MDVQQLKKIFPGKTILKKRLNFHVSSLDFHLSFKYISHISFQSPHPLSFFFPYYTHNFSLEPDLGATDSGNGFIAMLGVTHILS